MGKLEGEPEYEDLSKVDRLEAFEDYMKYSLLRSLCHGWDAMPHLVLFHVPIYMHSRVAFHFCVSNLYCQLEQLTGSHETLLWLLFALSWSLPVLR